MSKKGLVPNTERTPEELRENGRKGGLKAAEKKRKIRELRTLLTDFLSKEIPEEVINALKAAGYKDITLKERGALLLAWKMSKGDLRASLLVSKMIGEYNEELGFGDMEDTTPQAIRIVVAGDEEAAALADLENIEV